MKNNILLYLMFFIAMVFYGCDNQGNISVRVAIKPLEQEVIVGKEFDFFTDTIVESLLIWDFGDSSAHESGNHVKHVFNNEGVYTISMYSVFKNDTLLQSQAIINVCNEKDKDKPQVFLDTDARNEADDQHFIAYCLYSDDLDVIGISSVHNNEPGSEQANYGEVYHMFSLLHKTGVLWDSLPLNRVYHGATDMLQMPNSKVWNDTKPIRTEATEAILAVARGASPSNPVWIMPVGPCTNIASALLIAEQEGFNIKDRIRVYWLGGWKEQAINEYNGNNDPWSVYVSTQSGIDMTVMLADPTSLKLNLDKRVEGDLYPDNSLGKYLKCLMPIYQPGRNTPKSIHDVCVPIAIYSNYKQLGWVKKQKYVTLSGVENEYRWIDVDRISNVKLICDIDGEAMKQELFRVLNNK